MCFSANGAGHTAQRTLFRRRWVSPYRPDPWMMPVGKGCSSVSDADYSGQVPRKGLRSRRRVGGPKYHRP